jgi:uncharacterized membrane protein
MSEIENTMEFKTFEGYFKPTNSIVLSIIAIFAALTSILTFIVPITIPATNGYINLGDIGVMITGSLFGPIVGGIAGGIGSAFTDLFLAPVYAIPTLIIKGLEGFFIGLIANPRKNYHKFNYRDILAILVGGSIMVFGYFFVELIIYGLAGALFESIFNGAIQFGLAALATVIFDLTFRKNIIINLPQAFDKVFIFQ